MMLPERPKVPDSYGIKPLDMGRVVEWSWVASQLTAARSYWIVTASLSGSPHAAPVWGIWHDDNFYFGTDLQSRKGTNLAENHRAVVHLESGDEVVIVEGVANLVPAEGLPGRLDDAYSEKYGVRIAGGPVFRITPTKVLAWSERDFPESATRWMLKNDRHHS